MWWCRGQLKFSTPRSKYTHAPFTDTRCYGPSLHAAPPPTCSSLSNRDCYQTPLATNPMSTFDAAACFTYCSTGSAPPPQSGGNYYYSILTSTNAGVTTYQCRSYGSTCNAGQALSYTLLTCAIPGEHRSKVSLCWWL